MPGLPVHHQLPEFTQTHVHQVGDAIQPSHPLLSPSPSSFNLSQHQGLQISSSHQVAEVLEFQLQHQSFQWTLRIDLLLDGLVGSPWSPRNSQKSSPMPQFKSINYLALSFLYSTTLTTKITADGDCSHKIKRRLLLERKAMTNKDRILKSRVITLPTKIHLVKAMVFPVAMHGCESWTLKKAEHRRVDAFELWCWRRLLRVPWTRKSVLNTHWKD